MLINCLSEDTSPVRLELNIELNEATYEYLQRVLAVIKVTLSTDRMSRRRERCVSRVPNRWLPLLISIPSHPA